MQKIMYINNDNNGSNDKLKEVNDLLEKGWHVVEITCANDCAEGGIGGFVVLEKHLTDEERANLRK